MGRSQGKKKLSKVDVRSRSILLGEGGRVGGSNVGGILSQLDVLEARINNASKKKKLAALGLSEEEIEQIFTGLKNDLEPLLTDASVDDQLIKIHNLIAGKVSQSFREIEDVVELKMNFALLAIFDARTDYKEMLYKFNQRWLNNKQGKIDYSDLISEIKENLKFINLIDQTAVKSVSYRRAALRELARLLDLDIDNGRSWGIGHYAFEKDDVYANAAQVFLNKDGTISFDKTVLKLGLSNIGIVEPHQENKIEVVETRKNNQRKIVYSGLDKIAYRKDDQTQNKFTYKLKIIDSGEGLKFSFRVDFDEGPFFSNQGEVSSQDLESFNTQESWALDKIKSLLFKAIQNNR